MASTCIESDADDSHSSSWAGTSTAAAAAEGNFHDNFTIGDDLHRELGNDRPWWTMRSFLRAYLVPSFLPADVQLISLRTEGYSEGALYTSLGDGWCTLVGNQPPPLPPFFCCPLLPFQPIKRKSVANIHTHGTIAPIPKRLLCFWGTAGLMSLPFSPRPPLQAEEEEEWTTSNRNFCFRSIYFTHRILSGVRLFSSDSSFLLSLTLFPFLFQQRQKRYRFWGRPN